MQNIPQPDSANHEALLEPQDDGAAAHLPGVSMPDVRLPATDGEDVLLSGIEGLWVLYIYPRTGRPGVPSLEGWDKIPGARGCTPQSCSFRDHHAELRALGARVFGLSAQSCEEQREARERLRLPYQLLSDDGLKLRASLKLPTFVAAGIELYKRMSMVIEDGRIVKVFYPVHPPEKDAETVLGWLRARG